jgi:uncharacterized protein (TIGR00251 family)
MIIEVKVKPNARSSSLVQQQDGSWLAQIRALPIEGKANRELIELVAGQFNVRKSAVSIRSGSSGRTKLVSIDA